MLSEKNRQALNAFYDAVRDESERDRRTTILISMAAALSGNCAL